jgi:uncharacterized membrane protein
MTEQDAPGNAGAETRRSVKSGFTLLPPAAIVYRGWMRACKLCASVSLVALIALCLAWELWLAPLRPGGSWLALKALPLALPLGGILAGRRYTYQWTSLLVIAYFAEGATRAWAERGAAQALALAEVALSLVLFAAAVACARLSARGSG